MLRLRDLLWNVKNVKQLGLTLPGQQRERLLLSSGLQGAINKDFVSPEFVTEIWACYLSGEAWKHH